METITGKLNSYDISCIIKCQSVCRGWLARKKNIYSTHKKLKKCKSDYESTIKGYHMINKTPIKESVWEEINCDIVRNECSISDQANGNHISGKDNSFDNIDVSNKSTKIEGNNVTISSYRLTSVCNDKHNGTPQEILNEIEKRDKSFDCYSILMRRETNNNNRLLLVYNSQRLLYIQN